MIRLAAPSSEGNPDRIYLHQRRSEAGRTFGECPSKVSRSKPGSPKREFGEDLGRI
jgi:hypothetical protein